MNLSHRPLMTLNEYYIACAKCPWREMPNECKRAQKLKSMPCYKQVIKMHYDNIPLHITIDQYFYFMTADRIYKQLVDELYLGGY